MKMIIFDIDGTLLLAGGIGRAAFNRVFREMFDIENIWGNYDPHGKTDTIIIQELSQPALGRKLNHLELMEISRRYIQYFGEMFDEAAKFRLLPGVLELLDALSSREFHLGIATGNYEQTAACKLKRGNIHHYFSFGAYGSDAHDRAEMTAKALERGFKTLQKPVQKEDVFLVGDAEQDVRCAQALGIRSIAVATGSLPVERLRSFESDFVMPNLEDTNQFLDFVSGSSVKR